MNHLSKSTALPSVFSWDRSPFWQKCEHGGMQGPEIWWDSRCSSMKKSTAVCRKHKMLSVASQVQSNKYVAFQIRSLLIICSVRLCFYLEFHWLNMCSIFAYVGEGFNLGARLFWSESIPCLQPASSLLRWAVSIKIFCLISLGVSHSSRQWHFRIT